MVISKAERILQTGNQPVGGIIIVIVLSTNASSSVVCEHKFSRHACKYNAF